MAGGGGEAGSGRRRCCRSADWGRGTRAASSSWTRGSGPVTRSQGVVSSSGHRGREGTVAVGYSGLSFASG